MCKKCVGYGSFRLKSKEGKGFPNIFLIGHCSLRWALTGISAFSCTFGCGFGGMGGFILGMVSRPRQEHPSRLYVVTRRWMLVWLPCCNVKSKLRVESVLGPSLRHVYHPHVSRHLFHVIEGWRPIGTRQTMNSAYGWASVCGWANSDYSKGIC